MFFGLIVWLVPFLGFIACLFIVSRSFLFLIYVYITCYLFVRLCSVLFCCVMLFVYVCLFVCLLACLLVCLFVCLFVC